MWLSENFFPHPSPSLEECFLFTDAGITIISDIIIIIIIIIVVIIVVIIVIIIVIIVIINNIIVASVDTRLMELPKSH